MAARRRYAALGIDAESGEVDRLRAGETRPICQKALSGEGDMGRQTSSSDGGLFCGASTRLSLRFKL